MANATMSTVPAYLLGAAAMTPLQRMTRVATEGVAGDDGRFKSIEAGRYLRDLLADRLIGDDGKIMEKVVIPRIMEQYANEVLGSTVEEPGQNFSIMRAYNDWLDKVNDDESKVTEDDPVFPTPDEIPSPEGGDSGDPGMDYGGGLDTGQIASFGQMPNSFQEAIGAVLPGSSTALGIAQALTGVFGAGAPIGMDDLDPNPNIATNATDYFGLDEQGQTVPGLDTGVDTGIGIGMDPGGTPGGDDEGDPI